MNDPAKMDTYDWLLASSYTTVELTNERDIRAVRALNSLLRTGYFYLQEEDPT